MMYAVFTYAGKVFARSFTWDTGISMLPVIDRPVIMSNVLVKRKTKRGQRRAMAKAKNCK